MYDTPGTAGHALAGLILQLSQDGQVIGRWELGEKPLKMTLEDPETGQVVGEFTAAGPELDSFYDDVTSIHDVAEHEEDLWSPEQQIGTTSDPSPSTPEDLAIFEAEMWLRSTTGQWQKSAVLQVGQKACYRDARIRLKVDGSLVVEPGKCFSGGAELPEGGEQTIEPGQKASRFPFGTGVILTAPSGHGFYVKTRRIETDGRPLVEHHSRWSGPSNSYEPPSSDC